MKSGFAALGLVAGSVLAMAGAQPADAQLRDMLGRVADQVRGEPEVEEQRDTPPPVPFAPGRQQLTVEGYSAGFVPVRELMNDGQYAEAQALYLNDDRGVAARFMSANDAFLGSVEQGVMLFDGGQFEDAIAAFNIAEENVEYAVAGERRRGILGGIGRGLRRAVGAVGSVTGLRGLGPYSEQDYERILQLNYLTLSYLVQGDERAFNVMRRAATEQAVSRERFIQQLQESASNRADTDDADVSAQSAFFGEFERYDDVASRVPDAYVNPLGDYLTGLIFEIDAAENPQTLGNANAAYSDALELRPESSLLRAAVMSTNRSIPGDERLIHVLVGEGFAPTRHLLVYGLQYQDINTVLEYPMLVPIPSQVEHFDVYTTNGNRLGRLEALADVEAIVMRDQMDRLPLVWAEMFAGAWRTQYQRQQAGDNAIFRTGVAYLERLQMPDMRGWSSLPRRFHAARIEAPAGVSEVEVRAIGSGGRVLSRQRVQIDPQARHAFIYGRGTDAALDLTAPDTIWIDTY